MALPPLSHQLILFVICLLNLLQTMVLRILLLFFLLMTLPILTNTHIIHNLSIHILSFQVFSFFLEAHGLAERRMVLPGDRHEVAEDDADEEGGRGTPTVKRPDARERRFGLGNVGDVADPRQRDTDGPWHEGGGDFLDEEGRAEIEPLAPMAGLELVHLDDVGDHRVPDHEEGHDP